MQQFSCPAFLGMSLALAHVAGAPAGEHETPPPLATPASQPAKTAEVPAFQPGLWEYQRTVLSTADARPQTSSVRKCSDPTSEIRQKLDELQHKGCQFSRLPSRGGHYQSTWVCPSSSGPLVVRDTVTVNSANSYQDDNQIKAGPRVTHSTLVANRLGDCPTSATGLPPGIARALSPNKHP
jgi:hypothetical protein